MIKKHNNLSLVFGILGLVLQLFVFVPGLKLVGLLGIALLIVGLAYYAKAMGRHPAWGLLGLLSLLGILALMLLKDKTLSPEESARPQKSSPVVRVAMIVFLAFLLVVVLAAVLMHLFGGTN